MSVLSVYYSKLQNEMMLQKHFTSFHVVRGMEFVRSVTS